MPFFFFLNYHAVFGVIVEEVLTESVEDLKIHKLFFLEIYQI